MSSLSTAARMMRSARPLPISRQIFRQPALRRQAHSQVSEHDRCIPFDTNNRRAFAIKAFLYMGTGFAVPFIACWWQWNRPGGIHNPL